MAIFVRDGLTYRERPDLGVFLEGTLESVVIEIVRGGGKNDLVAVMYPNDTLLGCAEPPKNPDQDGCLVLQCNFGRILFG